MRIRLSREMPCGLRIDVEADSASVTVAGQVEDQLEGLEAAHLDRCNCDEDPELKAARARYAGTLVTAAPCHVPVSEEGAELIREARTRLGFVTPAPAGGDQEPTP